MSYTAVRRISIVSAVLITLLGLWLSLVHIGAQDGDIRYGETINGKLEANSTAEWNFIGSANDVITLRVERTSGNLLPSLLLLDRLGQAVAGTEANSPTATLVQVRLAEQGSYVIGIASADTSGSYRLSLTLLQAAPATPTLQPTSVTLPDPSTIQFNIPVEGQIDATLYRQLWRFNGTSGQVVDISMQTLAGDLDSYLALISPNGDLIASNDSGSGGPDAGIFAFQLPFNGEYTIIARRVGNNNGLSGTTTGTYSLSIILRGPSVSPNNAPLRYDDEPLFGRLTLDVPIAIYRVEAAANVAIHVQATGTSRLLRLRLLDVSGRVLDDYRGINPLLIATQTLKRDGPFFVEVSADNFENNAFTDFTISASRLAPDALNARPLYYDLAQPSNTPPTTATDTIPTTVMDHWFFAGQAGDIVQLNVQPTAPNLDYQVNVTSPQDVVVFEGTIGSQLNQIITLPRSGVYEIAIRPLSAPSVVSSLTQYAIQVERLGINGVSFAHFLAAPDVASLTTVVNSASRARTLDSDQAEAFWVDAQAGQALNITAQPTLNGSLLGIMLVRPDGTIQEVQTSDIVQGATLQRIQIQQTGRYRVVIFNVGSSSTDYSLTYSQASGGVLPTNRQVKGIVSPETGLSSWTLEAQNGSLINVHVNNLTPVAWEPEVLVVAPDGRVIASQRATEATPSEVQVLGVLAPLSGTYQILVAGQPNGQYASFQLLGNVQSPFNQASSTAVQLATNNPLDRYVGAPTNTPQMVNLADLIHRPIPARFLQLQQAAVLSFNNTQRAEILPSDLYQSWSFNSAANTTIAIRTVALTDDNAPDIMLFNAQGQLVTQQLRANRPTNTLVYRSSQGGTYIAVISMGLQGGRYLITLTAQNITLDNLTVDPGVPIVYGQTAQGEYLNNPNHDNYYFVGLPNDQISVQVTRTTGNFIPTMELTSPSGRILATTSNAIAETPQTTIRFDNVILPENGVYRLAVRHRVSTNNIAEGRYSLYLGLTDALRLRNRGGGILTTNQQYSSLLNPSNTDDIWLFTGQQGGRITLTLSTTQNPSPSPLSILLQDTLGHTFAMQEVALPQNVVRLNEVLLPDTGIYRVQILGGRQTSGIYTLQMTSDVRKDSLNPLQYGQTVTGLFTADVRSESWVFTGTANDVVSIAFRYQHGLPFTGGFTIFAENGLQLATGANDPTREGDIQVDVLLPFSGTYTVLVANTQADYSGKGIYALSLILTESQARSAGAILQSGVPTQGVIYTDDSSDTWIFLGQANDQVQLSAWAQDHFLHPQLDLRDTGGNLLASALMGADQATHIGDNGLFTIPANGVYSVTVSGVERTTGVYRLEFNRTPATQALTTPIRYGETRNGLIADDRPSEVYIFAGQQGDNVIFTARREQGSNLSMLLALQDEQGHVLANVDAGGAESVSMPAFTLPYTGSYRLVVSRYLKAQGQTFGRYTVQLQGTPRSIAVRGEISFVEAVIGRLSQDNPLERFTLKAQAGDVIDLTSRTTSGDLDTWLQVETSTGEVLAYNDDSVTTDAHIASLQLPADDIYTVTIGRIGNAVGGGSQGNYELAVTRLYRTGTATTTTPAGAAPILYGQRISDSVTGQGSKKIYSFSGEVGDVIRVQVLHQTEDAPPLVTLLDPTGSQLAQGQLGRGQTTIEAYRLPSTGPYLISIMQPLDARKAYSPFSLALDLMDSSSVTTSSGGILHVPQVVNGLFTAAENGHYWLFNGQAGTRLSVGLMRLDGDLDLSAIIIMPTGDKLITLRAASSSTTMALADAVSLPISGLYSILVLSGAEQRTGRYRLSVSLNDTSQVETPILAPATIVEDTLNALTLSRSWKIEAQAGQTVSAMMLATVGDLQPRLQLINNNGVIVAVGGLQQSEQYMISLIDSYTVTQNGPLTLLATAQDNTAGSFRLSWDRVPFQAEVLTASPITYQTTVSSVVRQNIPSRWVFQGQRGDAVTLAAMVDAQSLMTAPRLELRDSMGHLITAWSPQAKALTTEIETVILPRDDRYIVVVQHEATTSYRLFLQRRQDLLATDVQANNPPRVLVPNGSQANGIAVNDPLDFWTFDAAQGAIVQIDGQRTSGNLRLDLALYSPSGALIQTAVMSDTSDQVSLGPIRLPEQGTYRLVSTTWLGRAGITGGNYRLTLRFPPDNTFQDGGFIPSLNFKVTGQLSAQHPSNTWLFRGLAGQSLRVEWTGLEGLNPKVTLALPEQDPTVVTQPTITLSQDATYILEVSLPDSTWANGEDKPVLYSLTLQYTLLEISAISPQVPILYYGQPQHSHQLFPTDQAEQWWALPAKAGDDVNITITGASNPVVVQLRSPDGQVLGVASAPTGQPLQLYNISLPSTTTYSLVVTSKAQDYTVLVERNQPTALYQGQLMLGADSLASSHAQQGWLADAASIHEWHIQLATPSSLAARLDSSMAGFIGRLTITDLTGKIWGTAISTSVGQITLEVNHLPAGEYAILVSGNIAGLYRLVASYALSPLGGGRLHLDETAEGSLSSSDFSDEWQLTLADPMEAALIINITSGNLQTQIKVYGPAGDLIYQSTAEVVEPYSFTVRQAGTYHVIIMRRDGAAGLTNGTYQLEVGTKFF